MEEFEYADYVSEERIVPEEKLGKYNLPFMLFPGAFLFLFLINNGSALFMSGIEEYFTVKNLFLVFTTGFLAHELIHFITWHTLSRIPLEEFRIGMRWSSFTPVIGCQRPMGLNIFRVGLLLPFLLLGVLPMGLAFYFKNTWLLFSAVIFMAWASADIVTFLLLWNTRKDSFVEMHRNKLGCIVFNKKGIAEEVFPESL
jgi:hypothetical protein